MYKTISKLKTYFCNLLFTEFTNSSVLSVCYKADSKEIEEHGLTGENVLILIKNKGIKGLFSKKDINYFLN